MTVGELLSKAVDWIYQWWPLRIVKQWEQGLRLYAGEVVEVLTSKNGIRGTGLHWFIPALGEIRTHECNWEVVETLPQTVVSADGRLVTAQFAVTYRVKDMKAYYVSIQNQDDTVLGAVRAAAGTLIPVRPWSAIGDTLAADMLEAVKKRVYGWGLEVRDVVPTTLVHSPTLRLLSDGVGEQRRANAAQEG